MLRNVKMIAIINKVPGSIHTSNSKKILLCTQHHKGTLDRNQSGIRTPPVYQYRFSRTVVLHLVFLNRAMNNDRLNRWNLPASKNNKLSIRSGARNVAILYCLHRWRLYKQKRINQINKLWNDEINDIENLELISGCQKNICQIIKFFTTALLLAFSFL